MNLKIVFGTCELTHKFVYVYCIESLSQAQYMSVHGCHLTKSPGYCVVHVICSAVIVKCLFVPMLYVDVLYTI